MERLESSGTNEGKHETKAKKPSIYRGLILALLSGIFFSLVSVIVKKLKTLHSGQIALYRFIALFVTALPQVVRFDQNPLGPKKFWLHLFIRGIFGGTNIFLNFVSIRYLSLSEASVIIFSQPVFVTVIARIFLKEPCNLLQCFAVVLTVTGIVFTTKLPSQLTEEKVVFTRERLWGLFAAIGSVLSISFAVTLTRVVKSVPQAIQTFGYSLVTMTEALILTAIFGNFRWHHCGIEVIYILLIGLFSCAGQALMVFALQCEFAGPASTVRAATSIALAFLWQIIIFHEDPDIYGIIGATLVVFSIVFVGFSKFRSSNSKSSDIKNP